MHILEDPADAGQHILFKSNLQYEGHRFSFSSFQDTVCKTCIKTKAIAVLETY
jgi:hypothetical protein